MDTIIIKVSYNGKVHEFEAAFRSSAYTYSFVVQVNGQEIRFEPDEERELRAIVGADVQPGTHDSHLIALIGKEIARMLA